MALITAADVITLAIPSKNIDPSLLADSIPLAEVKYIKKAMGHQLYELIVSEFATNTYTGLNQTLLDNYIKPCLARYVVYEALPLMKAEMTSNGIQSLRTDFATPATGTDLGVLRSKLLSDAELYLHEMTQYIIHHQSSFPLYTCQREVGGKSLPFLY